MGRIGFKHQPSNRVLEEGAFYEDRGVAAALHFHGPLQRETAWEAHLDAVLPRGEPHSSIRCSDVRHTTYVVTVHPHVGFAIRHAHHEVHGRGRAAREPHDGGDGASAPKQEAAK
jgi:hypothetical protein